MRRVLLLFVSLIMVSGSPSANANDSATWDGFYVGGTAGYASVSSTDINPTSFNENPDGFIGGGVLGYNFNLNELFLIGIEGDFSGGDVDASGPCANPAFTCQAEMNWMATVRGRVGVKLDQIMLFATGGVAFADYDHPISGFPTAKTDFNGFVVGGGIEANLMPGINGRIEVHYHEFGAENIVNGGVVTRVRLDDVVVRAGITINLNHLFSGQI